MTQKFHHFKENQIKNARAKHSITVDVVDVAVVAVDVTIVLAVEDAVNQWLPDSTN